MRRAIAVPSRLSLAVVGATAVLASASVGAQEWTIVSGVASRAEYSDNYFFTASGTGAPGSVDARPESAFTLSVVPFVATSRRTEVAAVTALLSIGGNKVWGLSPSEDYLSARMSLDASLRQERGTWTGFASYTRAPQLQNVLRENAAVLSLAYTDTVAVGGGYQYQLDETWSLGTNASAFVNRYDNVQSTAALSDNRNFDIGGVLRQQLSDRTQLQYALDYAYSISDLTRNRILATRAGIVHRYSPSLVVSASGSWYWSKTSHRAGSSSLPPSVIAADNSDESGGLFGGGLLYVIAEGTELNASLSQGLAPTSLGTTRKTDYAGVGLSHRFSDLLTGRVGTSYSRTTFPDAIDGNYRDRTVQAEAGLSWRLAPQWTLDAGYRYMRTPYSSDGREPTSNVVFVSVGYNWPGASLTGWIGRPTQMPSLTGAGPLLPEPSGAAPATPLTTPPSEPFEPFTLP